MASKAEASASNDDEMLGRATRFGSENDLAGISATAKVLL
jgi:hypothetical protein